MHPYSRRRHLGRLQLNGVGDRYMHYHCLQSYLDVAMSLYLMNIAKLNSAENLLGIFIFDTYPK